MRRAAPLLFLVIAAACADSARHPVGPPTEGPRANHIARIDLCCDATLYVGGARQLKATIVDTAEHVIAGPLTWSSSNPAVASVDRYGYVRALAVGDVVVRAAAESRISNPVSIRVLTAPVVTRVEVAPNPVTVRVGSAVSLTARVYDQYGGEIKGKTIAWSVAHPSIATVSSGGVLSGVAAGSTTVRASVSGVTGTAPVSVKPYFSVALSGPDLVGSEGTYTWEALPTGGTGTYTYQWRILWAFGNPATTPLGTGKTQAMYVGPDTPAFTIVVDVVSGDDRLSAETYVCNVTNAMWGC